jgi:hypothetical protein
MPKAEVCLQALKQAGIGRRKLELRQLLATDPVEIGAPQWLELALTPLAPVEIQPYGFFRIGMREALDEFTDQDFDPELLSQLTFQTLFKSFIALAFTPWKFPQPCQVCLGLPLRNQQFSVTEDQPGGYVDNIHEKLPERWAAPLSGPRSCK